MDKSYIKYQYFEAIRKFRNAHSEKDQWDARKTMARLEQIAAQEHGFSFADELSSNARLIEY